MKWLQKYGQSCTEFYMQTVGVSRIQTERQPRFFSVGEPLFLTPLVEAGKLEEAREASKVLFFASFRKVKMHIS